MHVTAIIAAAGSGRRVGAAKPKQMLDIGGRTMIQHCLRAFLSHPRVTDVIARAYVVVHLLIHHDDIRIGPPREHADHRAVGGSQHGVG